MIDWLTDSCRDSLDRGRNKCGVTCVAIDAAPGTVRRNAASADNVAGARDGGRIE
jgi:hypothetical protein